MSSSESSEPLDLPHSPGSSVSSRFQEEYDELLRYAVVVPTFDPCQVPHSLSTPRGVFHPSRPPPKEIQQQRKCDDDDSTLEDLEISEETVDEETVDSHSEPEIKRGSHILKLNLNQNTSTPRTQQTESEDDDFRERVRVDEDVVYDAGVDPDLNRVEHLLDTWTCDLKRNIMAEFARTRVKSIEDHRTAIRMENEAHAAEVNHLLNEIESMKELLHTYEKSIVRKDQVIANLTDGMQKLKDKLELSKTFADWKIKHNDALREEFESKLAKKSYERALKKKTWDAWHSLVENSWKQRVEKACQAKASEVCMQLTNDYEARIASLNEAVDCARDEVARLHRERERYEEMMKKAFMRGVCALNLEAMGMFHEQDGKETTNDDRPHDEDDEDPFSGLGGAYTMSQEPVYNNEPPGAPHPRVVSIQPQSGRSSKTSASIGKQKAHPSKTTGTKVSAKITARTDSRLGSTRCSTLAPPMSSVTVERHHPVTKETLGHATANQYPKCPTRKIAGQGPGNVPLCSPRNVKVVE